MKNLLILLCLCYVYPTNAKSEVIANLVITGQTNPSTCVSYDGAIHFAVDLPDGTYSFNYNENGIKNIAVTVNSGSFSLTNLKEATYSTFWLVLEGGSNTIWTNVNLKAYALNITKINHPSLTTPTGCGKKDGTVTISTNLPDGSYSLTVRDPSHISADFPIVVSSGKFTFSSLSNGYHTFKITHNGCVTTEVSASLQLRIPMPLVSVSPPRTCGRGLVTFSTPFTGNVNFFYDKVPNDQWSSYVFPYTPINSGQLEIPVVSDIVATNFMYTKTHQEDSVYCDVHYIYTDTLTLTPSEALTLTLNEVTSTTCDGDKVVAVFQTNKIPGSELRVSYRHVETNQYDLSYIYLSPEGKFKLSNLTPGTYSNFSFSENRPGRYTNVISCSVMENIVITAPQTPTLAFVSGSHPPSCSRDEGSITLSTNLADGSYLFSYKKNGNAMPVHSVIVSSGIIVIGSLGYGTYSDFSITQNSCQYNLPSTVSLTCPCPSVINLVSATDDISAGSHNKVAASLGGKIMASNKITGTAKMNYQAASVELNPGFTSENGTVFVAQTGGCN